MSLTPVSSSYEDIGGVPSMQSCYSAGMKRCGIWDVGCGMGCGIIFDSTRFWIIPDIVLYGIRPDTRFLDRIPDRIPDSWPDSRSNTRFLTGFPTGYPIPDRIPDRIPDSWPDSRSDTRFLTAFPIGYPIPDRIPDRIPDSWPDTRFLTGYPIPDRIPNSWPDTRFLTGYRMYVISLMIIRENLLHKLPQMTFRNKIIWSIPCAIKSLEDHWKVIEFDIKLRKLTHL